jgi:hypothetical protein
MKVPLLLSRLDELLEDDATELLDGATLDELGETELLDGATLLLLGFGSAELLLSPLLLLLGTSSLSLLEEQEKVNAMAIKIAARKTGLVVVFIFVNIYFFLDFCAICVNLCEKCRFCVIYRVFFRFFALSIASQKHRHCALLWLQK